VTSETIEVEDGVAAGTSRPGCAATLNGTPAAPFYSCRSPRLWSSIGPDTGKWPVASLQSCFFGQRAHLEKNFKF
jgi:hypothetical protein